jgi:hypothetical protein
VESGGIILGSLCTCPDCGEFFLIATDVIEVLNARETAVSLMYSDETWARIQRIVKARRANPATREERIIGQCHGHNFRPGHGTQRKQCKNCEKQAECRLTSVFVSADDLLWSRSVFARQPWAFCLIYGLNARGNKVHGLFGFRGGRLIQRGFYLLAR